MTNKELQELLKDYDDDLTVRLLVDDQPVSTPSHEVDIRLEIYANISIEKLWVGHNGELFLEGRKEDDD